MARITVEDCIDKFESRFELVLVASNRARKIHSGENPTVEKDNDKPTVIALREIAEESLSVDSLKDKLIQEYQTVSPLDEEELSLDYADSDTKLNDEITEDEHLLNTESDINLNDEITEDEHPLNSENGEANISNVSESNEDEVEVDSTLAPKNDGYTDISDDKNSEIK